MISPEQEEKLWESGAFEAHFPLGTEGLPVVSDHKMPWYEG